MRRGALVVRDRADPTTTDISVINEERNSCCASWTPPNWGQDHTHIPRGNGSSDNPVRLPPRTEHPATRYELVTRRRVATWMIAAINGGRTAVGIFLKRRKNLWDVRWLAFRKTKLVQRSSDREDVILISFHGGCRCISVNQRSCLDHGAMK